MSGLDQAFIKAYQKAEQTAAQAPPRPHIPLAAFADAAHQGVDAAPADRSAMSAGAAPPRASVLSGADPDWTSTAAGDPYAAAAHTAPDAGATAGSHRFDAAGDHAAMDQSPSTIPFTERRSRLAPAAGSGHASLRWDMPHEAHHQPPIVEAAAADDPTETLGLRPLLQVDRYVWPGTVSGLIAESREALGQLAEELTARSHTARSVVVVVGTGRGAGASTAVMLLGRTLADQGKRVALVDAHFAQPHLATQLGIAAQQGWERVLDGALPAAEVLIESIEDQLDLLPACGAPATTVDLAAGDARREAVLDALARYYDVVLIDAGAADDQAMAWLTAGRWRADDVALLVCDTRTTTLVDVHRASDRLAAAGLNVEGVIDNFTRR